jgi:hypothetical protein
VNNNDLSQLDYGVFIGKNRAFISLFPPFFKGGNPKAYPLSEKRVIPDSTLQSRLRPFPQFPSFPFHARESKCFQGYLVPTAPLLLKGVRNFATIFTSPMAIYLKTQGFLVYIFVARLLIYFTIGETKEGTYSNATDRHNRPDFTE